MNAHSFSSELGRLQVSDLRERFEQRVSAEFEPGFVEMSQAIERAWPIIEAELQKRDKEHFDSLVKAESECLEETEQLSAKLTETNKLLEQTIEVLKGFPTHPLNWNNGDRWYNAQAKPLLDNLKAFKKEGTE
jgi:hypothetical protein